MKLLRTYIPVSYTHLRTYTDAETGQTIISGMGELHLDIIVDRMRREFHVECNVGQPQVSYRETIKKLSLIHIYYPVLQQLFFENLHDVELDDFYHAINKIEKTLIRTEADELTYPLHIMVRYDIEKAIIESNLDVHALPKLWNKLYQDYLGIEVPNDTKGILQDVHWAGGSFGYFPTYALGSAYAAQLYHQMKKELNIDEAFGADDLSKVCLLYTSRCV